MDRAPARRGRAAGDRAGSSRPAPNGARPRRRPPRPPPPQPATARSRPRPKNRARKRPPPPTIAIKLIVRRLPPTLTAEEFASYANHNGADKALWTAYYPGKVEAVGAVKRLAQVVRHSVAYLAFEKIEDASHFFQQFDAFKFVDTAKTVDSSLQSGTDYYARVERAMYQPTPPLNRRRPPSPLEGTIESDPDYLTFLAELKGDAEREQSELAATLASASTVVGRPSTNDNDSSAAKKQVITPLMEDVRARRRERDERRKAKAGVRGGRSKLRSNAPQPTPPPSASKSNEHTESTKLGARRKKRRGGDNANSSKREEPVQDRKSSNSPSNERRNGEIRPVENNVSTPANSVSSSLYTSSTASMNSATSGKGGSSRGGNGGRSRYARGQKGRGRLGQSGNGTVTVSTRNEQQGCVALSMP